VFTGRAGHTGALAAAGSGAVPWLGRMILAYPTGIHASAASWRHSLRFPAPFNLARIFSGAVAFIPCLECGIATDSVAEQPFDLGQPP
jgi:hypothetical protein